MRKAFTILELLAASALTALLMLAVLRVVGSLGRSRAALLRQEDSSVWKADLRDTLRADLLNSTGVSFAPNETTLVGHGSLDRSTLARVQEPVTVVYQVVNIRGRPWLVRRQQPRDGLSNAPGWSELLCPDVSSFGLRAAGGLFTAGVLKAQEGSKDAIPPVVAVSINGPRGQIMNETMVLR